MRYGTPGLRLLNSPKFLDTPLQGRELYLPAGMCYYVTYSDEPSVSGGVKGTPRKKELEQLDGLTELPRRVSFLTEEGPAR